MKNEAFSNFFFTIKKFKLSIFAIFILSFVTFLLLMKFFDKNSDDYTIKLNSSVIQHGYLNPFYYGMSDYLYTQLNYLDNFVSFDRDKLKIFFKIRSTEEVDILNSKVELMIDNYMKIINEEAESIKESYLKFKELKPNSDVSSVLFDSYRLSDDFNNDFKLYQINKNESEVIVRKFNNFENIIISFFISFCIAALYLIFQMYKNFKN